MAEKNDKPAEPRIILDALDEDITRHKRLAWNYAKGKPALEAFYREQIGEPPE